MAEHEIEGGAGKVKVETTEGGKTRVSQEFDSTVDALEFADQAARKRRSELGLMDKVIAWDEWFSPKARRVGETVLKITAAMGSIDPVCCGRDELGRGGNSLAAGRAVS